MSAKMTEQLVHVLEIMKEEEIAAPIGLDFEAILEQMGPENESPGTGRMPMILEAWPGGRWFRDLGDGSGHFWGNVQAIKPPTSLKSVDHSLCPILRCQTCNTRSPRKMASPISSSRTRQWLIFPTMRASKLAGKS